MNTILNLVLKLYNCIANIVYASVNIVKYCSNFVQILREKKIVQIMYKYYVRVLYKYCVKDIVQILCKYCTNIHQIFDKYFANTFKILWEYCTINVKTMHIYCANIAQILCKYCANIAQILCKYCVNIVQIWQIQFAYYPSIVWRFQNCWKTALVSYFQ